MNQEQSEKFFEKIFKWERALNSTLPNADEKTKETWEALLSFIEQEVELRAWNAARESIAPKSLVRELFKYPELADYNNRSEPLNEKK